MAVRVPWRLTLASIMHSLRNRVATEGTLSPLAGKAWEKAWRPACARKTMIVTHNLPRARYQRVIDNADKRRQSPSECAQMLVSAIPPARASSTLKPEPPVVAVAAVGRVELLSALLALGQPVNGRGEYLDEDDKGWYTNEHVFDDDTPLMAACRAGHLECVRALLAAGADATLTRYDEGYFSPALERSYHVCFVLHGYCCSLSLRTYVLTVAVCGISQATAWDYARRAQHAECALLVGRAAFEQTLPKYEAQWTTLSSALAPAAGPDRERWGASFESVGRKLLAGELAPRNEELAASWLVRAFKCKSTACGCRNVARASKPRRGRGSS